MSRVTILVLIAFPVALLGNGSLMADQKEAEEALKGKGLAKRMTCFCLAEEAELSKLVLGRQTEAAKRMKAVDEAQAKAQAAKEALDKVEAYAKACREEYDALNIQLQALAPTSPQRNRLVERNNFLVAVLNAAPGRVQQAEKAMQQARTSASQQREAFIQYVMQLRKKYEALQASYKELGSDPEVKKALDEYNRTASKPCTLGPLKTTTEALGKLAADVLTDAIPIHQGGGQLWHVFVTINDKQPPMEIAIDTGASMVSLPYKDAAAVGLTPGSDAPQVTLQLADGRTIQAHQVVAKTVRVGKFSAKDVKCAVFPADIPAASAMLGLSYLNNFTYKVDKTKGLLIMAGIEEHAAGPGRPSSRTGPAAKGTKGQPTADSPAKPEEAKPDPAATPAEQLEKLLALDGAGAANEQGRLVFQMGGGREVVFRPSKRGPAKTLQDRFGDPDEIRKIPAPHTSDDTPAAKDAPPWKIWTWGTVQVIVDDTGKTRYFAVGK
jgi:clan AA aspartic protease (TIGR02281 family)